MQDQTCAGVPDDAVFSPNVSRVWAIQLADQVRLVFSNHAISCAAARGGAGLQGNFTSELADLSRKTCSDGYVFDFGVPDPEPGVVDLAEVGISSTEGMVQIEQGFGCSPECYAGAAMGSLPAVGAPDAPVFHGPDATLEIYSVTDECFSGRLSNYKSHQTLPLPPDMNGAFIAQWCPAEE